jgi:hypothetical protein
VTIIYGKAFKRIKEKSHDGQIVARFEEELKI